MKNSNNPLVGVVILVALIAIAILPKTTPTSTKKPSTSPTKSTVSNQKDIVTPSSSYARSISLNNGNAAYAYQPYEEYITIINRGKESVNITNWKLKNSKDKRAYDFGGTLRYFPSDTATIGQATLFISPQGLNKLQDVVLQVGETAIVTTGLAGSQSPFKIVSFKENICSGYLENMPEYKFTPPLTRNCPRPAKEVGIEALDTECRKFVERMASCYTPKFDTKDKNGDICHNCVDGKPLSGSCVAFIKNHFNYTSCIAYHQNDTNFSSRTWRVFLGNGWEMWAQKYETIELFDQFGQLVNTRSY